MKTLRKLFLIAFLGLLAVPLVAQTNMGNFRRLNVSTLMSMVSDSLRWEGTTVYKDSLYYTQIQGDSCRFKKLGTNTWSTWIGGGSGKTYTLSVEGDVDGAWIKLTSSLGSVDSLLIQEGQNTLITAPDPDTINIDAIPATYELYAASDGDGAWIKILGSDGTRDSVLLKESGDITVTFTDADTVLFASTYVPETYSLPVVAGVNGVWVHLIGSKGVKDSVFFGENGGIGITKYAGDSILFQNTVTQISYGLETVPDANGAWVKILGSNGAKDSIFLKKGSNINLSQLAQDTIEVANTYSVDLSGIRDTLVFHSDSLSAIYDSLGLHRDTLTDHYERIVVLEGHTNASYSFKAAPGTNGTFITVEGTDGMRDSIFLQDAGNLYVDYVNDSTIAFSVLVYTYDLSVVDVGGSVWIKNYAAPVEKDSINLIGSGAVTITRTTEHSMTINAPSVNLQGIRDTLIFHSDSLRMIYDSLDLHRDTLWDHSDRIVLLEKRVPTTYTVSAETGTGGAYVKILGSDGSKDSVKLAESARMNIIRTDANTITFASDSVAYNLSAETGTGGAWLKMLGDDGSKDSVKLANSGTLSITRTDANTIAISGIGSEVDPLSLHIDQTSRDTVINGRPVFSEGVILGLTPVLSGPEDGWLFYDTIHKTVSMILPHGVTMQIGQEDFVMAWNATGTTIPNGSLVYRTGVSGEFPTIALADAEDYTTSLVLGMATEDIETGDWGYVTTRGIVHEVDTDSWPSGTALYLAEGAPGTYTDAPPVDIEDFAVVIGYVLEVGATGSIFVEYTPNNRLSDLYDVRISTPVVDQLLKWNGVHWVNGAGVTVSGSAGSAFYADDAEVLAVGGNNSRRVETLLKIPRTAAEQPEVVEPVTTDISPKMIEAYVYGSPLNRIKLDAGTWSFETYCSVNTNTSGSPSISRAVYQVIDGEGTLSTVRSGTTAAVTQTNTTGQFVSGDATANITTCGYLQTPQGLYEITGYTNTKVVAVTVLVTYANETNIPAGSWRIWRRLFTTQTVDIPYVGTSYGLISTKSTQGEFTTSVSDRIACIVFANATGSKTINFLHNGAVRASFFTAPVSSLHGDLAGLQGGTGAVPDEEYYHLDSLEYVGTGSGVFAKKTSPVFVTPTLGAALATSINGNTFTSGSGTLTLSTYTLSSTGNGSVKGTNTGDVTYDFSAETGTGGAWAKILGSDGSKDSVKFTAGTNMTSITRTDANTITFNASGGAADTWTLASAPLWLTSTLYAVGDIVYFNYSTLRAHYLCITEHTSTGSYPDQNDAANWRIVNFMGLAPLYIQDSLAMGTTPADWSGQDTIGVTAKATKAYIDANVHGESYGISSEIGTGGSWLKLLGSGGTKDSVKFAAGTNMTSIVRTDANTMTFNASGGGATYTISAETGSGGAWMKILGSDGSKDSVKLAAGTNMTSVVRTDANTITLNAATQGATGLVEDMAFEFADIIYGTAQVYTLDISATYAYTINSIFLEVDSGTLTGVALKIGADVTKNCSNSTAVTSCDNMTADTGVDEITATGANTVAVGNRIFLCTAATYTGIPTLLRGKVKITRL